MPIRTHRSRRLSVVLLAVLAVSLGLTAGPSGALTAPPPPTVSVTSPAAGATVSGTVGITAQASAAPGDLASDIQFFDGANLIASSPCPAEQACTATVQWPATGLSGAHALTAKLDTRAGMTATSVPVPVTVVSPALSVAITAPATGDTVAGTVTISAVGGTDPSQDDVPTRIAIYDGLSLIGAFDCPPQRTCAGSVAWVTTGLTGAHDLAALVTTSRGLWAVSGRVNVTIGTAAPTVTITSPKPNAALGGRLTVSASAATDPGQPDHPASIAIYDGTKLIATITCGGQPSCSGSIRWSTAGLTGRHSLTARVRTSTGRSATSAPVSVGRGPLGQSRPTCHLSAHSAKVGKQVNGNCVASGVPSGTPAAIAYRTGTGGLATAARGRIAHGGTFSFRLRGTRPGLLHLVIVISRNRHFARTAAPIGTLRIR
jgi:hypothetical protein